MFPIIFNYHMLNTFISYYNVQLIRSYYTRSIIAHHTKKKNSIKNVFTDIAHWH